MRFPYNSSIPNTFTMLPPCFPVTDSENDDAGEVSAVIPAVPVKAPRGRSKPVDKFNWSDGSTELLIGQMEVQSS